MLGLLICLEKMIPKVFRKTRRHNGIQILDDRPNIEIFDSNRMGIDGEKSENGAIGHIHLADLR